MATKLKNLSISKVAVVDEGANPDAHIRMMKRKDLDVQPPEGDSGKGNGNILKKLFAFIGKAAGMDQEEIDSAVEEIQKGDSTSFSEKINEANNRKIYDEMWDVCYALQSALCSILNDEELDAPGTAAAMQESLDQFYAVAKDSIGKWSGGKPAEIVKMDSEVSESDLAVMKSALERLNESMKKAGKSSGDTGKKDKEEKPKEDGKDKDNQEGDEEEMKIDKSKLTEAEKAFLESIEKRYGTGEEAPERESGAAETSTVLDAAGQGESSWDSVSKSGNAADGNAQDDIYKGIHPAVRAELEELKKFREAAEEKELSEIAKKYAIIGKKEEELVPLLKSLKSAGGTAYKDMLAVLDQTVDAVEKSGVFSEIGKSGHGGSADGGAWAEAETKAVELMKSKAGLTKAQAIDEVLMSDPALAERCEKEE
ncbi:MAG: hypothetical protein K2P76_11605 [Lachnospiraceae bacterium]|nr:hypothetical protein [Lachnospiraceae bacterium]MDE6980237.1 hypothetical protein [Lachnospiraceae bacterium]